MGPRISREFLSIWTRVLAFISQLLRLRSLSDETMLLSDIVTRYSGCFHAGS